MKLKSSRRSRRTLTGRWWQLFSSSRPCRSPGTLCSRSLWSQKFWKMRLHHHLTIRGTCTRVGEVLLAKHSSWCTWEGCKVWLYWWIVQSVFARDLRGGWPDSGDSKSARLPLILFVVWFGVWASSTLEQMSNICVMSSTCFMVGLCYPLICRVIILEKYEFWQHRAYSIMIVDTKSCIHRCLRRQSTLDWGWVV